jgi:hypothetical protein
MRPVAAETTAVQCGLIRQAMPMDPFQREKSRKAAEFLATA